MRHLALILALTTSAHAVDNGWLRTGGSYDYTDPVNWSGGQINDVFSQELLIDHSLYLQFPSSYTARQGIRFESPIDNTLDNGSSYVANVYFKPMNAGLVLTLGGDLIVHPKSVTAEVPDFFFRDSGESLRIDLGGADRVFDIANANLRTDGGVQGDGAIIKTGNGNLRLTGNGTLLGVWICARAFLLSRNLRR